MLICDLHLMNNHILYKLLMQVLIHVIFLVNLYKQIRPEPNTQ